jgi:deoxyribonuclease IV
LAQNEVMKDISHRVGFHASTAGGVAAAVKEGDAFGCEVIQIFTKNNLRWFGKPFSEGELAAFAQARAASPMTEIWGHSGYLINLAAVNPETLEKSRQSLLHELDRSAQLGLPFLVLHPGAAKGRSVEEGLDLVLESLAWVFERTSSPTKIALEATAGAGTVLGRTTEELAYLLDRSPSSSRLAVCLDTCHLFASGYDLRGALGVQNYVKGFKKLIDWQRVVVVHMNDSVGGLGSHLDRHALLGEGQIGWETFEEILTNPDFAGLPLCLETPPGEGRTNDVKTLARMMAIRGGKS